ncbi:MAG: [FeFe] hydrogenase H-cluster maturation GTPase HydF, partial [Clostridia bacterium]|nr:[FeFe] hydrogenase H-cluster maturation GTPase HydF [Clostridia bacterium]
YDLIVHCGACMLNEKEMKSRVSRAKASGTPIVNYGIAIAHMHGILKRSLSPFPEIQDLI